MKYLAISSTMNNGMNSKMSADPTPMRHTSPATLARMSLRTSGASMAAGRSGPTPMDIDGLDNFLAGGFASPAAGTGLAGAGAGVALGGAGGAGGNGDPGAPGPGSVLCGSA